MGRAFCAGLVLLLVAAGCSDSGTTPQDDDGPLVRIAVENLPAAPVLASRGQVVDGRYQGWVVDRDDQLHSVGGLEPEGADARWEVERTSPVSDPVAFLITLELPDSVSAGSALHTLVGGRFTGGVAELDVVGYLTPNLPLEPSPGVHILKAHGVSGPSGLPNRDDAGIWLVDPEGDTLDASAYATFTPLTEGWTYEGWVVRDHGTEDEVWVSYGQFRPDGFRKASRRDETGLGPFSGRADYRRALPLLIEYPGDDWLANPLGLPVPGGLELPFDLNGCTAPAAECEAEGQEPGPSRWTHVITVEPFLQRERAEPWLARPSFLRPYRNAIGEDDPHVRREIRFRPENLPRGTAEIVG